MLECRGAGEVEVGWFTAVQTIAGIRPNDKWNVEALAWAWGGTYAAGSTGAILSLGASRRCRRDTFAERSKLRPVFGKLHVL